MKCPRCTGSFMIKNLGEVFIEANFKEPEDEREKEAAKKAMSGKSHLFFCGSCEKIWIELDEPGQVLNEEEVLKRGYF